MQRGEPRTGTTYKTAEGLREESQMSGCRARDVGNAPGIRLHGTLRARRTDPMCSADTVKSVTVLGQKPHPAATRALFTRLSARRRPSLMGRVTRLRSPQVPPPRRPRPPRQSLCLRVPFGAEPTQGILLMSETTDTFQIRKHEPATAQVVNNFPHLPDSHQ